MTDQGQDIQELFKPSGHSTLRFTYNGKEWTFKYQAVSWEMHFNCVETAWDTREVADELTGNKSTEPFFNASKYYEEILLASLVSGPGNKPVTRMELRMLDSEIIRHLITVVPGPNLADKVSAAKKEHETS